MQFTEDGFSISTDEIMLTFMLLVSIYFFSKIIWRLIQSKYNSSTKNDGIFKFGQTKPIIPVEDDQDDDEEEENDEYYESEEEKKMKFEEDINGIPFKYDEKTKILTIGFGSRSVTVQLDDFNQFREFVDRLEEYIQEE